MDGQEFISYLMAKPVYRDQICHIENILPRPACYGDLEKPLSCIMEKALKSRGLWPLYSHQTEAINLIQKGRNIILATSSSSGKSLVYNIPVLEDMIGNDTTRALYLFPTKALAHDQLKSLEALLAATRIKSIKACSYDGDTATEERSNIRNKARLVVTNPDMLHLGILPRHAEWSRFFANLKYIILDEAHAYRGVFGSNVSLIVRRLRRICRYYGSQPLLILSSATIANPQEHAEKLAGITFSVVDEDGSPSGPRQFVFWNPPRNDPQRQDRKSSNSEASLLFSELVRHDIRTIAFARSRRLVELIFSYTRDRLASISPGHVERIKPYRAGYIAEVRRQIESELASGQLTGVVATNALELGIDVGHLEATLITGYPGSIASTWQQAGRSGRSGRRAITILVGRNDPLDQYLMSHPESFFNKRFENALVNPDNPYILDNHLLCAAWENPLTDQDSTIFGSYFSQALDRLVSTGRITKRHERWFLSAGSDYPAKSVDIRSCSGTAVSIVNMGNGSIVDSMDRSNALFQAHPGAVYLNQGDSYLISELNIENNIALAQPVDSSYYTIADDLTTLRIIKEQRCRYVANTRVCLGQVEVKTAIIAYKKREQFSEKLLDTLPLDLPDDTFNSIGLWFNINPGIVSELNQKRLDLAGGLHAIEHASIGILPLFALCDRNDIGGVSTVLHSDTGKPQVFIYDAHPGGIGIAEKGYEMITELWRAVFQLLTSCGCDEGCPGCIQSPKCGNNNQPLDKKAAIKILQMLIY